jgi:hypothetical protein
VGYDFGPASNSLEVQLGYLRGREAGAACRRWGIDSAGSAKTHRRGQILDGPDRSRA